jgi:chromosomal replication initiator protein
MSQIWNSVVSRLKSEVFVSGPKLALLKQAKLVHFEERESQMHALLSVPSSLSASLFQHMVLPEILEGLSQKVGRPVHVEFEINSTQQSFAPETLLTEPVLRLQETPIRFKTKLTLNPSQTLNTFVETSENRFAIRAVQQYCHPDAVPFPILTFFGPSGVGKTHLLHAAGWEMQLRLAHPKLRILSADDFITDFQTAIAKKAMGDFRRRYRLECDVLLIDDLHSICRAKGTQEELFNLINHFVGTGRRIIFASSNEVGSLEGLDDGLRSRLLGGLMIGLKYPSEESRKRILRAKLESADLHLKDEMIERLAAGLGPCVRSLEGVAHKLGLVNRGGRLDLKEIMALIPSLSAPPEEPKGPDAILKEVAVKHGFKIRDLKGRNRSHPLVQARRESMRRMRDELGLSLGEIGRYHQRDHSTVIALLKS